MLLDIDPVELARGHRRPGGEGLFDYVNDRPYVASSFLSVALSRVPCPDVPRIEPELVEEALQVKITMLPCRGARILSAGFLSRWATRWLSRVTRWTKSFPGGEKAVIIL